MTSRPHPFQKLCLVSSSARRTSILVAAAGSSIHTYDFSTNKLLSHGPPFYEESDDVEGDASPVNGPNSAKRRKLNHGPTASISREASDESIEIVAERQKGQRKRPKVEDSKVPNVSHVLATTDGATVLAVTTEDKCITVFALAETGELEVKSRRSMPKRLCSITLTPDERTIIAADKFGDVYSLPLHFRTDYVAKSDGKLEQTGFQPSATQLTVHTKGNLEALKQQLEQKKVNPRKEGPKFEHKLMLGHVSLLTDVAIATIKAEPRDRLFLLTSDRDEHVRVSRYPQGHVIHSYCLGFSDFVSKICVVPWAQRYMIAGSGEPSLKIFDWQHGQLMSQVMVNDLLDKQASTSSHPTDPDRAMEKLAVSGIWPFSFTETNVMAEMRRVEGILVALEGLPLLLSFWFQESGHLYHHQTITLSGNVLDVSVTVDRRMIAIVSLDNIHRPGSMVKEREETAHSQMVTVIELDQSTSSWTEQRDVFELRSGGIEETSHFPCAPQARPLGSSRARGEYSSLGDFLYGLENLRKKRDAQAEELEGSVFAADEE